VGFAARNPPYCVTTGLDPVVHADVPLAWIAVSSPAMTALLSVMPGFMPGIHVFLAVRKTWMAGTSPVMTR
jgi:hypothetical protein